MATILMSFRHQTSRPFHGSYSHRRIQSKIFATTSIVKTQQQEQKHKSFLSFLWNLYCQSLDRNPLITKTTMASIIFASSDTATQVLSNSSSSTIDGARIASAGTFGVVATTWLHFWWNALERIVHRRIPTTHNYKWANTITKVAIDQTIGAPFYIYTYYVLTNWTTQTASFDTALSTWNSVHQKAQQMLMPTMMQHWKLWPIVHTINFYYTPIHHRVLVQNTVLIFWSAYLSHLNHSTVESGKLMTPDEEINSAIVRRDSIRPMKMESSN